MTTARTTPATVKEKVEQLSRWALEDGDPDVYDLCERALEGDTTRGQQALELWPVWAEMHGERA